MGKKFDDRQQGDDMMSGLGQGLSREDRKNQHVLAMFKKQERTQLRKEQRGRKVVAQSEGGFEKPQNLNRGHGNSHVPNQTGNHAKSNNRAEGHSGTNNHKQRQTYPFGVSFNKPKDVPPITVRFSESVMKQNNNSYFFRRKNSFEERQRQIYNTQMQQFAYNQQQMRQAAFANYNMNFGLPPQQQNPFPAQMQMQSNQQFGHCQNMQQVNGGQQGLMNAGNSQLNPHQQANFMMSAGTGGLYDPVIDGESGQASSISSASKASNQIQGINQNGAEDHTIHPLHIPKPSMLMVQSAPLAAVSGTNYGPVRSNIYNPHLYQQTSSAGGSVMPNRMFITGTDSSEIEDSSGSYQREVPPGNSPLNMLSQQQIGTVAGQIPPHLLYQRQTHLRNNQTITGHSNFAGKQNDQQIQKKAAKRDISNDSVDEQEMKLIMERTREEQKRLKGEKFIIKDLGPLETDVRPQIKNQEEEQKK